MDNADATTTVLCFGDSNTWGADPETDSRHAYRDRWTTVLAAELGGEYRVIPEGLNGRTTVLEDPLDQDRAGIRMLPALLQSHKPLNLVIIMLGTNDCKTRFAMSAEEIGEGMRRLVQVVRVSGAGPQAAGRPAGEGVPSDAVAPAVMLVSPPEIRESTSFGTMFVGGREKSRALPAAFRSVCREEGVDFFHAGDAASCSEMDGIHLDAAAQRALGAALAREVRRLVAGAALPGSRRPPTM